MDTADETVMEKARALAPAVIGDEDDGETAEAQIKKHLAMIGVHPMLFQRAREQQGLPLWPFTLAVMEKAKTLEGVRLIMSNPETLLAYGLITSSEEEHHRAFQTWVMVISGRNWGGDEEKVGRAWCDLGRKDEIRNAVPIDVEDGVGI